MYFVFDFMFPLFNTNHIYIGVVYILASIFGGSSGFAFSALLRLELSIPGFVLNALQTYATISSLHGIIMLFLFVMPILIGGFGNFFVPLMLSYTDMLLPRLNLLSLWLALYSVVAI